MNDFIGDEYYYKNVNSNVNIVENRLDEILSQLSQDAIEEYNCFIWGMGGQPKQTYQRMLSNSNFTVLWSGSVVNRGFLRLIANIIPSQAGLLKIRHLNILNIKNVFFELGESSMVGFYFIENKSIASDFIENVKITPSNIDLINDKIKKDNSFFSYTVDFDSNEDESVCEMIFSRKNALIKLMP